MMTSVAIELLEHSCFLRMYFNDFDGHSDIWPDTGVISE